MAKPRLSYWVKTMDADGLATQGARASAIMVLTYFSEIFRTQHHKGWYVHIPSGTCHYRPLIPHHTWSYGEEMVIKSFKTSRSHLYFMTATHLYISYSRFRCIFVWKYCSEFNKGLWHDFRGIVLMLSRLYKIQASNSKYMCTSLHDTIVVSTKV